MKVCDFCLDYLASNQTSCGHNYHDAHKQCCKDFIENDPVIGRKT